MSVGKMNQLFQNQGFLTPEKRCSKRPARYRYEKPKNFKVFSQFDGKNLVFPHMCPSAEEILEAPPAEQSNFYLIHPKPRPFVYRSPDLDEEIKSCLGMIKASKDKRKMVNHIRSVTLEKSNEKALKSIEKDIKTISQLSQDMASLHEFLMNYA
jgi:hypothetical protein